MALARILWKYVEQSLCDLMEQELHKVPASKRTFERVPDAVKTAHALFDAFQRVPSLVTWAQQHPDRWARWKQRACPGASKGKDGDDPASPPTSEDIQHTLRHTPLLPRVIEACLETGAPFPFDMAVLWTRQSWDVRFKVLIHDPDTIGFNVLDPHEPPVSLRPEPYDPSEVNVEVDYVVKTKLIHGELINICPVDAWTHARAPRDRAPEWAAAVLMPGMHRVWGHRAVDVREDAVHPLLASPPMAEETSLRSVAWLNVTPMPVRDPDTRDTLSPDVENPRYQDNRVLPLERLDGFCPIDIPRR